ncbi:MAG: carbamoyltransferase [Hellea sp.]
MKYILGISGLYHDSAAALIGDGNILAAAQEERFSRKKHDAGFPRNAIQYCLNNQNITLDDVCHVVFYDKPLLKFERLLETYLAIAPKGFASFRRAMPVWLREKLFLKDLILKELRKLSSEFKPDQILFTEHHFSHAASAFYPSPFENALVLTLDGVGEWATTTVSIGKGSSLEIVKEIHFPHSLGLLYSAFTYYVGFKVNSGEYKLMGLAPYGTPRFKDMILEKIVDLKDDGSFRLNQSYFNYSGGLTMTNNRFADLFGYKVRKADIDPIAQHHMDIAASIQSVIEHIVLTMTRSLSKEYGISNLCLAGGVALNCVANGKILRDSQYDNIWIQPAAGDAGGAIGAALAAWHTEFDHPRIPQKPDAMSGSYLGPQYSDEDIIEEIEAVGGIFNCVSDDECIDTTAYALSEGKAVGWFQGRMEFGPRALGGRSILGDPRSPDMQKTLNLKIKYRESFRPFAPSILSEDVGGWFKLDTPSPYMLIVADVDDKIRTKPGTPDVSQSLSERINEIRSLIPAVTHVDHSARIQTVHKDTNKKYHDLVSKFKSITGCPILVNTSFNVRGEPIVCTPTDAFNCFMGTQMDMLVIGNCILSKTEQSPSLLQDYKHKYKLD